APLRLGESVDCVAERVLKALYSGRRRQLHLRAHVQAYTVANLVSCVEEARRRDQRHNLGAHLLQRKIHVDTARRVHKQWAQRNDESASVGPLWKKRIVLRDALVEALLRRREGRLAGEGG